MFEDLINWDINAFEWVYQSAHTNWLDVLMPFWREKTTWIPLYIGLLVFLIWRFKQRTLPIILGVLVTVAVCDTTSSKIIKPTVKRARPCQQVAGQKAAVPLINCGSGYSFPSSHSTNHFGVAVFLTTAVFFSTWSRIFWIVWAASIAYGQVYVGVHYPIDIIVGALLGTLIGFAFAKLTLRLAASLYPK